MFNSLRGDPDSLRQKIHEHQKEYPTNREDGTKKGPGYFGEVYNKDGEQFFTTELPTKVFNVYGHMTLLIPAVVPTLNREELAHLAAGGQPTWQITEKAKRHAEERLAKGKSPFAVFGEQKELPK